MVERTRACVLGLALVLCAGAALAQPGAANPTESLRLGLEERAGQRLQAAIQHFERGLAADPSRADIGSELAMTLAWTGQHERAIATFDQVLEHTPDHRGASLGRARVLVWAGKVQAARVAYEKALDRDPRDLEALRGMALVHRSELELEEARSYYQQVLSAAPEDRESLEGLAAIARERRFRIEAGFASISFNQESPFLSARGFLSYRFDSTLTGYVGYEPTLSTGVGASISAAASTLVHVARIGGVARLGERGTLNTSYQLRLQEDDTVHALDVGGSLRLSDAWVALAGVRPGVASDGRLEALVNAGLQAFVSNDTWLLGQLFAFTDTNGRFSRSAVGTLYTPLFDETSLRTSLGLGHLDGAASASMSASLTQKLSDASELRLTYEHTFQPLVRQAVRLDWGMGL